MRARVCALLATLAIAAAAGSARAQGAASLLAGSPELEAATGELALLLAGRGRDGSPAPISEPQLFLDSKGPLAPSGREKLFDYAAEHPKWAPPIAIGVVYLWAQGAPQTIMDGLEALFRQVPPRLAVYPTPYGQGYRKLVTKVTAGRVAGGDLAEYPQLSGEHYKLVEALRFNLRQLVEDRAPIKLLFIVTDGRGEAARRDWSPFASVGEELRRAGIQVTVVSFAPAVDPAEAATNLQELAAAARARHIVVERPAAELPTQLESLAEVAAFERVRFELPWMARHTGGERKLVIKATVGGAVVRAPAITVALPGRGGTLFAVLAGIVAAIGFGVAAFLVLGRRGPRVRRRTSTRSSGHEATGTPPPAARSPVRPRVRSGGDGRHAHGQGDAPHAVDVQVDTGAVAPQREPQAVRAREVTPDAAPPRGLAADLQAARSAPVRPGGASVGIPGINPAFDPRTAEIAELVRQGVPPSRAVLALSLALGEHAESVINDSRVTARATGVLATRAGQARVRELRNLFAAYPAREVFLRDVAPILAGALREQIPASEAARRLRARLPRESWSSLVRLSMSAAQEATGVAARMLSELGAPSGVGFVHAVREELRRTPPGAALALWLVRAAGPGAAGQHIPIPRSSVIGGPGAEVVLSDSDERLVPAHATIELRGGDAVITPRNGPVALDGASLTAPHHLHDGHTLSLGRSLFVVLLVRTGAVAHDDAQNLRTL